MLINTVILFLSDVLPIVIMMTLLFASNTHSPTPWRGLSYSITIGFFLILMLINLLDELSLSFEGMGFEISFSVGYFLIYSAIVISLIVKQMRYKSSFWQFYSLIGLALVIGLNGTNLLIYISAFWTQADALKSLLIGMVLGAGICLSIGILLYFLMVYCDQHLSAYSSSLLLLLYGVGQINQLSNLLLQIDLLPSSQALWDLNDVIRENSELGQLLHALVGYIATPTTAQIIIYLIAVAIPLGLFYLLPKLKTNKNKEKLTREKNKNNSTQEKFS